MQIIKLDATDSTNTYLKRLLHNNKTDDYIVVVANEQLKGRGQRDSFWQSEAGKNLTFSVLKRHDNLSIQNFFKINSCVSIALMSCLGHYSIPDLFVKWPNDIMSGTSKVCGILIENVVSGSSIKASVIGVGLNVNQLSFPSLDNASSLSLIMGRTFDLDELLERFLQELKLTFSEFTSISFDESLNRYEQMLFKKDSLSVFSKGANEKFKGIIRGVTKEGRLIVELENGLSTNFDLKEVQLLY
jgi:BirA family biotin operon repressor/biotin-[acetyl-CoA-carboxylase] ligase